MRTFPPKRTFPLLKAIRGRVQTFHAVTEEKRAIFGVDRILVRDSRQSRPVTMLQARPMLFISKAFWILAKEYGDKGMTTNWRNLTRPRAKDSGAGPTYNRLNREKEGRREGGGRVCSSDELG